MDNLNDINSMNNNPDIADEMDGVQNIIDEMYDEPEKAADPTVHTAENVKAAMDAAPDYSIHAHTVDDISDEDTAPMSEFTFEEIKDAKPDYNEPWHEPVYTASADNARAYSPNSTGGYTAPHRTKRKNKSVGRVVGLAVALALICSIFGGGSAYLVTNAMLKNSSASTTKSVVIGAKADTSNADTSKSGTTQTVSVTGDTLSRKDIYALACEQVVGINTPVTTTNIFGQSTSSAVTGSGFIISEDGYILTNYHVIKYSALYGYDLNVILHDGTTHPAEIIGYEEGNDVAVIKINMTGLNPVTFGDSSTLEVGDEVYAVGNPLGELEYSMTGGMVSALERNVTTEEDVTLNVFQFDAAVNSGNSGGPVYNSNGEVVGIVTAKYKDTGVEGLSFAIPIDDAVNISTQLISQGFVSGKAYLGVNVQDVTDTYVYYLNFPKGAYVYSFANNSAAQAAGMKISDIITAIDDNPITSTSTLKAALQKYSVGDTAKITVYRSGEYLTLDVTFDERTAENSSTEETQQGQEQQQQQGQQQGQPQQGDIPSDFPSDFFDFFSEIPSGGGRSGYGN